MYLFFDVNFTIFITYHLEDAVHCEEKVTQSDSK